MLLFENIFIALATLKANKMRAFLTMIGIVIGIGAVIAIATIGNSLTASVTATMEDMGANSIVVHIRERGENDFGPGNPGSPMAGSAAMPEDEDLITDADLELFAARFRDKIETISLSRGIGAGEAREGRLYANVSIMGVNPGYAQAGNLELLAGRFINDRDIKRVKRAAVVSDRLVNNIFGEGTSPLGREVKIHTDSINTYTIVGVYKYETLAFAPGTAAEEEITTNLYIPISLANQDAATQNHQSFTVISKTGIDATLFAREIETYFAGVYEHNPKWEAGVMNMESIIAEMTSILETVSLAVAIIAAISLLVGGIGVMNIMLVSVTERTREIGTRKALGARSAYIRAQFIVEAVTICLTGGMIGIVLGLLLGALGASLLGFPATASPAVIAISVSVTILIGIFFGYYPANKAAKLDPIEALRYE